MDDQLKKQAAITDRPTGVLVLASGEVFYGHGCGAIGDAPGEVCFNTAMTGYQEILTDPSYAQQIVLFTFPHIGNTGTNEDDEEAACGAASTAARGAIFREHITAPSNYRSQAPLGDWLVERGIVGLSGIDTRALTSHIRETGMPSGVIAHNPDGEFDITALQTKARNWPGLVDADLAKTVSTDERYKWNETGWRWGEGYGKTKDAEKHVVVIDYGTKRNILRCLADAGMRSTVVPAGTDAADILALGPDGVVLSNGPGDPAATGAYAIPIVKELIDSEVPMLGICLGHQIMALALGAKTLKMAQGHHGANHPVKDFETGKVEIVSMNHGFAVDSDTLPDTVVETHRSLFDGSNCGIRLKDRPVFSVQHHPEASPGPRDSFYLFERFRAAL
ncbi:glutamine-hydrolyzing carbamoyl-phosphate synthase small subunit [bacterium AH-315-J19]|nr:glutamine-hydrolyzing carbamoyl-phosphate synthase small subunit [Robiginitomaculum sp.]MBN4058401.1 glutamine-hydrolyzing carbamoyl-phosphate synthase small subunit [bacterium AH-315-J19]